MTPGETVLFRIDDTAGGYTHNVYIGFEEELSEPRATTGFGIPIWTSGVEELEWTLPHDITA